MMNATATFGAGCFWEVQTAFDTLFGVLKTTVGYAGGITKHPTYEQVCTGETRHAEVIQIKYDSSKISYKQLLNKLWNIHDPTTKNRQGLDTGTQYRSVIFYHDENQKNTAKTSKKEQEKKIGKIITTEIIPFTEFTPAEEEHQHYQKKNGNVC